VRHIAAPLFGSASADGDAATPARLYEAQEASADGLCGGKLLEE